MRDFLRRTDRNRVAYHATLTATTGEEEIVSKAEEAGLRSGQRLRTDASRLQAGLFSLRAPWRGCRMEDTATLLSRAAPTEELRAKSQGTKTLRPSLRQKV